MRRAARRDQNEPELIKAARKLGWLLYQLDTPCDWLGCFRTKWYPVEIKKPKGKFTPAQIKFMGECTFMNAPYLVWRTIDDVLNSSA